MMDAVDSKGVGIGGNFEIASAAIGCHRGIDARRDLELRAILFEGGVAKDEFQEVTAYGECRTVALS